MIAQDKRPPLTDRQQDILDFIRDTIAASQHPPTVREIGARFDINSPNGVICHLKSLEAKGYIERDKNLSRGIRLLGEKRCPHCGK